MLILFHLEVRGLSSPLNPAKQQDYSSAQIERCICDRHHPKKEEVTEEQETKSDTKPLPMNSLFEAVPELIFQLTNQISI